ncbi:hypothetical protein [Myxosarcina sp. GI1(2024)]
MKYNVHIQPDGRVLYRCSIGWFSVKEVAKEFGYKENERDREILQQHTTPIESQRKERQLTLF